MKPICKAGIIIFIISFLIIGCNNKNSHIGKIVIAEQYGLAYAPLIVAKELGIFEKNLGEEIEWIKLGNTTAIREAMVSGNLDIGFMGIPPFLIGYDKGMKWNIFTGLSECPVDLITKKENTFSIKDIKKDDRIVLPQPGSIQHILLSMAAEREFLDAKFFDNQLVTMNHQDGLSSMISDTDIKYHFTSPPYNFEELKLENARKILSGKDAFNGNFTFIVGVVNSEFMKKNNNSRIEKIKDSIDEAITIVENDKEKTLDILEKYFSIERETLKEYVYNDEMKFSENVEGLEEFSKFMYKNEYIEKFYDSDELIFTGE